MNWNSYSFFGTPCLLPQTQPLMSFSGLLSASLTFHTDPWSLPRFGPFTLARLVFQTASLPTLCPCPDQSLDWDALLISCHTKSFKLNPNLNCSGRLPHVPGLQPSHFLWTCLWTSLPCVDGDIFMCASLKPHTARILLRVTWRQPCLNVPQEKIKSLVEFLAHLRLCAWACIETTPR